MDLKKNPFKVVKSSYQLTKKKGGRILPYQFGFRAFVSKMDQDFFESEYLHSFDSLHL